MSSSSYPSYTEPMIHHSMAFDLDSDLDEVENESYNVYCYLTPKACLSSAQSPPWEILKTPCKKIVSFAPDMEDAPLIPQADSRDECDEENLGLNTSRATFLRPRYSAWRHDAKAAVAIFRRCDDSLKTGNDCFNGNTTARIATKQETAAEMVTASKPPPSRRSSLDLSGANARTYSALAA